MHSDTMVLDDGRTMAWAELGAPSGSVTLVHHHGTTSSRLEMAILDEDLASRGIRVIAPDRPGYGRSSPWGRGHRVVEATPDLVRLAEHLGLESFAVSGYSGGGPYALAMAASDALGSRVTRVLLRASVAPEMGPRDPRDARIHERAGHIAWDDYLEWFADDPDEPAEMTPSDEAYFADPAIVEGAMATVTEGARQGIEGTAADLWAFAQPWGFDLANLGQPVVIWHGDADTRVPVAHARELAAQLPDATLHVIPGAGHFAIAAALSDALDLLGPSPP